MKYLIATIGMILLFMGGYHLRPNIDSAVNSYWLGQIDRIATDSKYTEDSKSDSLLVLSLNFRQQKRMELAWPALLAADSVGQDDPLLKGLLGLYQLEMSDKASTIEWWKAGSRLAPEDPNLPYLASLDTAELQYVDYHMLEAMFVDSLINRRLEVALYHTPDTTLISSTQKKIRIEESINTTYAVTGIALIIVTLLSTFRIRRRLKKRRADRAAAPAAEARTPGHASRSEDESEDDQKSDSMTKPLHYVVAVSSLLKIGQVVAALFNYFMLGSDINEFVSDYVFTPRNLVDLFQSNFMFAGIFVLIIIFEFIRRRNFRLSPTG